MIQHLYTRGMKNYAQVIYLRPNCLHVWEREPPILAHWSRYSRCINFMYEF